METYICLISVSGTGMREFNFDDPDIADRTAKKGLEAVGGRLLNVWTTLGRFDVIAVVEVPDAAAVRAFVACLPANMKTETLRAFSGQVAQTDFLANAKKVLKAME